MRNEPVLDLARAIRAQAHAGGGWGYYPGNAPVVEATCWALTALHATWDEPGSWDEFAKPAVDFLSRCQTPAGTLSDTRGTTVNLAFNGLAATVLPSVGGQRGAEMATMISAALTGMKGLAVSEPDARQNNSLQAWPWYPDTFSWIEPTAWCTLALKTCRSAVTPAVRNRLDEAERLIENRCCDDGGWNYGNASVIGQDLRPHVPPTALTLIALQDRSDRPYVRRSLDFLVRARLKEPTSLALGLTALALRIHGRDTGEVEARLLDACSVSVERGNLTAMAIALFALTAGHHHARTIRVA